MTNNTKGFLFMNQSAYIMQPGSVSFIPAWIILLITIFTLAILFPKLFIPKNFKERSPLINSFLFAFIIGSLMPIFDDLFTFIFGPPFAHHSLFHSFPGSAITYILFWIISNQTYAKYALLGNLFHLLFNFYFDYLTLFFPFTYQEFGLTSIIGVSTYLIKVINYPIIFILFAYAIFKFFRSQKNIA